MNVSKSLVSHTYSHTEVDRESVCPLRHVILVVSAVQFGKCGEAGRAHPILEMLVVSQVRKVGRVIAGRITCSPIRRRNNLAKVVRRRGRVLLGLTWPCDTPFGEVVRGDTIHRVKESQIRKCI